MLVAGIYRVSYIVCVFVCAAILDEDSGAEDGEGSDDDESEEESGGESLLKHTIACCIGAC